MSETDDHRLTRSHPTPGEDPRDRDHQLFDPERAEDLSEHRHVEHEDDDAPPDDMGLSSDSHDPTERP
jgi:hypothetical protein